MEIFFEGIILRPWSSNDAIQLAGICDNKKIADNLRDGFPNPYTLDDARNWLRMILPENDPVSIPYLRRNLENISCRWQVSIGKKDKSLSEAETLVPYPMAISYLFTISHL